MTLERAALMHHPANVLRDLEEARAAAQRFGISLVQRGTDGHWRPICRTAADRATRLRQIKAEVGLTPAAAHAARAARLEAIALDLAVDRLRAWRRSGHGMIDLPGTAKGRR